MSDALGWDNPVSAVLRARNCAGEEVVATYDADRIRLHGAGRPRDAVVLVAGDSYTHGNAVADDASYPAALERILGVPTANLGVSGYGPDQALLRLESAIARFPHAKVAILSILYDDTARMLNRFRPDPAAADRARVRPEALCRGRRLPGDPGRKPVWQLRPLHGGGAQRLRHGLLAPAARAFPTRRASPR